MARANYAAWHTDPTEFSDNWSNSQKLKFFGRLATLAPSVHNTQPWRLTLKADTLSVHVDPSRQLEYTAKQVHEPYISLGAFIETFEQAAQSFGHSVAIDNPADGSHVADIRIAGRTISNADIFEAIVHRTSNRHAYATDPIAKQTLDEIVSHDLTGASVFLISSKQEIEWMARLAAVATEAVMTEQTFREELSGWVRNNLTRKYDGMPGFVQGMPTPISLVARHVIKHVDVSRDQAKKDARLLTQSAHLVLISTPDPEDTRSLLACGRLYARICLQAKRHKYDTSAVTAPIAYGPTREEIIQRLPGANCPVALLRLGSAQKPGRHTPRIPIDRLIHND